MATTTATPVQASEPVEVVISSRQRVWRRFRKHRLAMTSLWVLVAMYLVMFFANVIAPYTDTESVKSQSFAPPTAIHVMKDGHLTAPYIYPWVRKFDPQTLLVGYVQDRSKTYPVHLFAHGTETKLLWAIPTVVHLFGVDAPAHIYLFGADQTGRDLFSRILYGSRVSLTVGILAIFVILPLGMLVGGIAGYYGGWVDNVLMRVVEALMAFPYFYLLLALFAATAQWNIDSKQRYLLISLILALVGWTGLARVIRGQVLSIKANEYVEASRAAGAPHLYIIVKHVLPQTATWVIVSASLMVPNFILSESALSALGVGVQEPSASWGNMLQQALNIASLTLYPWLTIPGLFITLAILAFNFLGDGLRDAFDTKRRA
jgi:peptide/nickel transport system permease protein